MVNGSNISPKILKGAFVQLIEDVVYVVPNIITFQFNPEKLSRSVTPWNPFEVDQTQRGSQAPTVQPFIPKETFTFTISLDATDELEKGDPVALATGIADRLAALKKLILPTKGLIGDLIASAGALAGGAADQAERPTVPVVLFVWGPGRILPVRITNFSVDETMFSPALYPTHATLNVTLEVLTPDVFKCHESVTAKVAIAAYNATRMQEDALAAVNVANNLESILSLLPL